jgi:hypothetical protein
MPLVQSGAVVAAALQGFGLLWLTFTLLVLNSGENDTRSGYLSMPGAISLFIGIIISIINGALVFIA